MGALLGALLTVGFATSPDALARLRLRIDAGLDQLRTPIVEGLRRRGPTVGMGLDYAFSPAYSAVWSFGFRSLGTHREVYDIVDNGPTVLSSSIGLRVAPGWEHARWTPYVSAGIGVVRARWRGSVFLVPPSKGSETAWTVPLTLGVQLRLGDAPISAIFVEGKHEFTQTERIFPTGMEWWGLSVGMTLELPPRRH